MKLANRLFQILTALFVFTSAAYSQQATTQVILHQNYSNPFNPTTIIRYALPEASNVSLKLYDVVGKEVKVLVDEWETPGAYSVTLVTSNFSSGMYFLNLRAGRFNTTKRMVFLK